MYFGFSVELLSVKGRKKFCIKKEQTNLHHRLQQWTRSVWNAEKY